jgi:hypothetical protein
MKTGSKILLALIVVGGVFYKACTKPENNPNDERMPDEHNRVAQTSGTASVMNSDPIVIGEWSISYFRKSQTDQTSVFANDVFGFGRNGAIVVFENGNKTQGTWAKGGNDNPDYIEISFPAGSKFSALNGGWVQKVSTNLEMHLEQLGNDPNKDLLNFTKIEHKDLPHRS